ISGGSLFSNNHKTGAFSFVKKLEPGVDSYLLQSYYVNADFSNNNPFDFTFSLYVQFSNSEFKKFLEDSKNRIFKITIYYSEIQSQNSTVQLNSFNIQNRVVSGMVDGNKSDYTFKVDQEMWIKAIENTKEAEYFTNQILITQPSKKVIKEFVDIVKDAEDLLYKGKIPEAMGKVRIIVEALGYKAKSEANRYTELENFSFESREKEDFKKFLDAIFSWSSDPHHSTIKSDDKFTEEQAQMSIHFAYLVIYYLSKKQLEG
ncbi:MAG: hypothetical protein ACYCUW_08745, partial [bacterium]